MSWSLNGRTEVAGRKLEDIHSRFRNNQCSDPEVP